MIMPSLAPGISRFIVPQLPHKTLLVEIGKRPGVILRTLPHPWEKKQVQTHRSIQKSNS